MFLVGSGIAVALNLTIEHGIIRSQTGHLPLPGYKRYDPRRWLWWLTQVPGVLLLYFAYRASERDGIFKLAEIVAGAAAAFTAVLIAQLGQFFIADPSGYRPNYLIYPFDTIPVLGPLLDAAHSLEWPFSPWLRNKSDKLTVALARHPNWLRGFLYRDPPNHPAIYSGYIFATVLALLSFGIWLVLGAFKQGNIGGQPSGTTIPSLAYVCLALMVLAWIFSFLTFFFDRWRVPLLLILIGWCYLVGRSTETDHYYRVSVDPQSQLKLPKPSDILASKKHPVIIATAGGGIQAGAWTARVIQGIEEKSGNLLVENTALVSSVSGGSMGSLFFGAYLHDNFPKKLDSLGDVSRQTRLSSLDEVAWGLVNPDLWRTLWPKVKDPVIDRGWALERTWEERSGTQEVYLSDWGALTLSKHLPAFMFNATVIETGSPVVFTDSAFPAPDPDSWARRIRHIRNVQDLHGPDGKVRVSTAARLSATFPYVSPAPRGYPSPATHIVDGGYYDNYGVTTAIAWLMEALPAPQPSAPLPVAIVLIRPDSGADDKSGRITGWNYQLFAPLDGILNIRSDDQLRANLGLLDLIQKNSARVSVRTFEFAYPRKAPKGCDNQPMSWKLTGLQQACIDETWDTELNNPQSDTAKHLVDLTQYLKGENAQR